jgi:hypothetical protein
MEKDINIFKICYLLKLEILNNNINNYQNLFEFNPFNCFLIKSKDNTIKSIKNHKDFNPNEGDNMIARIRKSIKTNDYEAINPINELKLYKSRFSDNCLDDKLWFPVKSQKYIDEGNNQNYILNENDIIKIGKKKYNVFMKNCSLEEKKSSIINDDNSNNNISYISSINKKSKPILNFDIKSDQYIINNNKNNEKVDEVNKHQIKCSNEDKNGFSLCSIGDIEKIYLNQNRNERRAFTENEIIYETEDKKETSNRSENRNFTENENEYDYNKCWLCFNSDSDANNPLISLCNCHNFIHYQCLKMYLSLKLIITENSKRTVTTYRCEKFNCDICNKPYYLRFRILEFDKTYELIDLTLPEGTDYIGLESLDYIKDNNNIKTLHIVKLEGQEITIGKQESNDIIDYDISESTDYAMLRYNKSNGNLFLENKSEKFDTLVLVRGNIKIKEEKTFFQIGNTKISMKLKISKLEKDAIYSDNSCC